MVHAFPKDMCPKENVIAILQPSALTISLRGVMVKALNTV